MSEVKDCGAQAVRQSAPWLPYLTYVLGKVLSFHGLAFAASPYRDRASVLTGDF